VSGELVAFGPSKKRQKGLMAFRCPPDLLEWLAARKKDSGVTMTDALVWSVQSGRDLYDATAAVADDLEKLANEEGLTRSAMLRRIIERGLKAYTSGRKQPARR
jgi:hypothetical protein